MRRLAAALALVALAGGIALAQERGERPRVVQADGPGRALFARWCAPCHGTGPGDDGDAQLPGTAALARRYQGSKPAELELRTDLPAPVMQLFVRRGIGAMPAFRPTELSDAQIAAIADYLAATARASRQQL